MVARERTIQTRKKWFSIIADVNVKRIEMTLKRVPFNINHIIYVKLTEAGKEELRKQHDELRKYFPSLGEYTPIKEDEFGWSRWQLWTLMSQLGHLCNMGATQLPFETYMEFLIEEINMK
jgi:hypothetical protein